MFEHYIKRAKGLALTPTIEWEVIEHESLDAPSLYKSWIIPLAAVPAIAGFIGTSIVGVSAFGLHSRAPVFSGIFTALIFFALMLAGVYLFALSVNFLAPYFGAQKNFKQALKLAAYAPTIAWIAGALRILPSFSLLVLAGAIYSLYLVFVGLPILMNPLKGKAVPYGVSVVIVAIALSFTLGSVTKTVSAHKAPNSARDIRLNQGIKAITGTSQNGDLGGMLSAMDDGSQDIISDLEAFEKLAPDHLDTLVRTEVRVTTQDALVKMARLDALYEGSGGRRINLQIVNSPAINFVKTMIGMSGKMRDIKKADGNFELLSRENGVLVLQTWNAKTAEGHFAQSYKNFVISVKGKDVPVKTLKKAANMISFDGLDRLPKTDNLRR